ncbi:23S rRNA (pseudouridine(1915)-N(3))-methyltransferase RlmH [Helicobacter sp. 23-1045]
MKIKIYTISKKAHNCGDYEKMLKSFGVDLEVVNIMNTKILGAQKISPDSARESYSAELMRFVATDSANFALDCKGKELDSIGFSEVLQNCGTNKMNFFVGGAYGFAKDFLSKTQNLSLSKLTFSHKIVPLILCEQIYRAFCIANRHPYHK